MDTVINKVNQITNIFGEADNYNLIDLLTLKAFVNVLKVSGSSISVTEISFRVLSFYWHVDFESSDSHHEIRSLNDLRGKLITRYGLSLESSENDIFQILNYAQDKSLEINLFGTIKSSLNILSQIGQNKTQNNKIQNQLGLYGKVFFKVKSNSSIHIDQTWHKVVIDNYFNIISEVDNMLQRLLYPEKQLHSAVFEVTEKIEVFPKKNSDYKKDFKGLYDIEKRILLQMNLNKKQYNCLEEALYWLNIDNDLFISTHEQFVEYIRMTSFKSVSLELPLVTVAMLLYSAVYLYNDDESGGFWDEFFGIGTSYVYQRDVELAMNCLEVMVKKYGIDTSARHYMQKKNLSEIFSHIYLPEISLKKMFTALYNYYFSNRNHHLFNKSEFLEVNQYRLDKPGLYFLGDDEILVDIFDSIIELVDDGVNGRQIRIDEILPKRFYTAFDSWLLNEKKELDHRREDYCICSPNIELDCINEGIYIYLPKQKSRLYSDDICGWEIVIDGNKTSVPGRIIRQQSGSYIVLDEKIQINDFRIIKVSYIFNNKKQGEWDFCNDKKILIFDKNHIYQKKAVVKRSACFFAIPKQWKFDHDCLIDQYEVSGWNDFIIYNLELTEYRERELIINQSIKISIEDEPAVMRSNFKLLFENWNVMPLFDTINIYKYIGSLVLTSPYIELKDIQIYYNDLESGTDMSEFIRCTKISNNKIQLVFNENINSGSYNVTVKYKNRTCFRDSFIVDHETKVVLGNFDSYEKVSSVNRKIKIEAGHDIEIISDDFDTRVEQIGQTYLIETITGSIANFIYKIGRTEILIKKIVKPVKSEVVGLDDLLETRESEKTKEITKEVFSNNSVGLYVKNLDGKYEYLVYELLMVDHISNDSISNIRKLKFGEDFSWDFNGLSDRVLGFKNIKIVLNIKDKDDSLLTSSVILRVIEHIIIFNMKTDVEDNIMTISWKEKQINKQRNVTLFNITEPREKAKEYEIDDGATMIKIELNKLSYGAYVMVVGFKKELSLFDSVNTTIEFFERDDIKNVFINKKGTRKSNGNEQLIMCIWMLYREKYESLEKLLKEINLSKLDIFDVFVTLVQMKHIAKNDEKGTIVFLKSIFILLKELLKHNSKNMLLSVLVEYKDELEKRDLAFLITALLSIRMGEKLPESMIDELAEIDLVGALGAVENGIGSLSRNLVMKCRESFDVELLAPDVVRKHHRILEIINDEVTIINGFWNWLIEHRNNYLLKHDFSKARLFRMYELEKEISTYKVAGRTIDEMVDNLVNTELCLKANLPARWHEDYKIDQLVYDTFNRVIGENKLSAYKDILSTAFIVVTKFPTYTEESLFELSMRCQLSNRAEMYNRYRAYLKLIFL